MTLNKLKKAMEKQTENITLSKMTRKKILDGIKNKEHSVSYTLKNFLDREIEIPLKPFIAITSIILIVFGIGLFSIVHVRQKDIDDYKIKVISFEEGENTRWE